MASKDEIKGEGFEILDHEQEKKGGGGESAEAEGEDVKGEGFEILDHKEGERPEDVEGRAEARPEGQEKKAEAPTGEGAARVEGEQAAPIDVYSVLKLSVAQLAGVAWQMMGLQPDPFTNQTRKDVAQARLAIDAAAALIEQLKPHVHGQEARDYENLLADLRLNFVTHSGEEQKQE